MNFKKYIEKYKKKSVGSKISDAVFIVIIIAMLIPSGRLALGGFVNRIRAMIVAPSVNSEKNLRILSESDYQWQLTNSQEVPVEFSDFKGKVIFLNFWATWCPPCIGEMPEIQKLYDLYKNDSRIQFIVVTNEPIKKAKDFTAKRDYTFPVYSSVSKIPKILESNTIPTTFIISKDRKILVNETGATNWSGNKTQKLIEKLINK